MKKILVVVCLFLGVILAAPTKVQGYDGLAEAHCKQFPLDLVWRLATGQLSELYGPRYKELDGYIRQFVGPDNADNPHLEVIEVSQDSEEEQKQQEDESPTVDPIVTSYLEGLARCGLNWQPKDVYTIWRFVRFLVNHDYLYEWIRTEMRGHFGYEILKPNAFMDGQQAQERLRLEKLYSNDYLDELEDVIYRDFLYPFMTAIKENEVVAVSGDHCKNGNPILINMLKTRNLNVDIFLPVILHVNGKEIFAFTLPGLPLLLAGSSTEVAWAFTGILVDRTNVESLEISKYKYFDELAEKWIKVKNITENIKVKGEEDYIVRYYLTEHGPLFRPPKSEAKQRENIMKRRENEPKLRNIFSRIQQLIDNPTEKVPIYHPFNSMIVINEQGIHTCLLQQEHPSYFIYPDLLGQARQMRPIWSSNPKRGFYYIFNKHLTAQNTEGYLDREIFNSREEVIHDTIRRWKDDGNIDITSLMNKLQSSSYDINNRKICNLLTSVYRKSKFTYFPQDDIRKECDQLVALLDKWDYTSNDEEKATIYKLWVYFLKKNTFNHLTKSELAKDFARFRVITDTYLTNQIELWSKVVSFGQCDSHEYTDHYEILVNHTGHNCSCFFNIFKGINRTRMFLKENHGLLNTSIDNYKRRVEWDVLDHEVQTNPTFTDQDIAFENTYGKNMVFATDLGKQILFSHDDQEKLEDFRWGQTSTNTGDQTKEEPVQVDDQL